MATSDRSALRSLLASSQRPLPEATWQTASDLARASVEAFIAQTEGDARAIPSKGQLRLWGPGVDGQRADLESFGVIAATWQRAVNAFGASLEGVLSGKGKLPQARPTRTALVVTASPAGGSVVLRIEAKAEPLQEVEPEGRGYLTSPDSSHEVLQPPRPLVDRASDELLDVLSIVGSVSPDDFEAAEQRIRDRGPRAASALKTLASALSSADINIDADWEEPGAPTRRSTLSSSQAKWVSQFIDGRDLDTEVEEMSGEAITVSSRERWLIEVDGELEKVQIAALSREVASSVSPGDHVRLEVEVRSKVQPDGVLRTTRLARRVIEVTKPNPGAEPA